MWMHYYETRRCLDVAWLQGHIETTASSYIKKIWCKILGLNFHVHYCSRYMLQCYREHNYFNILEVLADSDTNIYMYIYISTSSYSNACKFRYTAIFKAV